MHQFTRRLAVVSLAFVGLACGFALPMAAHADPLTPGGHDSGVVTSIGPGVVELGMDNVLVLDFRDDAVSSGGSVSGLGVSFIGGPTLRVFVMPNFSVALNLNLLLEKRTSTVTDAAGAETKTLDDNSLGFVGTVMADYYVRLGRGMFFKPGLGGGGFFLSHRLPGAVDGTRVIENSAGGIVRAQLGLVYYTSRRFNLKAGVDLLALFGSRKAQTDGAEARSLMEIHAGWNVGFGYVF